VHQVHQAFQASGEASSAAEGHQTRDFFIYSIRVDADPKHFPEEDVRPEDVQYEIRPLGHDTEAAEAPAHVSQVAPVLVHVAGQRQVVRHPDPTEI
jgi:hypothetical protein